MMLTCTITIACWWCMANPQPPITLAQLLDESSRLETWTRLPSPPFRAIEQTHLSSPPRELVSNEEVVRAAAARDGAGAVIFDQAGPGVFTRLYWAGNPTAHLSLYLDGAAEPVFAGRLADWGQGAFAPVASPFVSLEGDRLQIDYPIPFARRCRWVAHWDRSDGEPRFQISARAYASTVPVETFTLAEAQRMEVEHARWKSIRSAASADGSGDMGQGHRRYPVSLSAEKPAMEIQVPSGQGGVIRSLHLRPSAMDPKILRESVLAISFDGRTTVRVPAVEFFGSTAGGKAFDSAAAALSKDGELVLRWPMPFAERAEIVLEGPGEPPLVRSDKPKVGPLKKIFRPREAQRLKREQFRPAVIAPPEEIKLEGYAVVSPYKWDERSLYFHAQWQQTSLQGSERDAAAMEVAGRGIWVGSTLNAARPSRPWWGDGEDLLQVDRGAALAVTGSGVADFFGLSRSPTRVSTSGLRGLSFSEGPGSFGHSSFYRWRLLDAVPFEQGLWFSWRLRPEDSAGGTISTVNYWYADPWSSESLPYLTKQEVAWTELPRRVVPRREGAIEGEAMTVVRAEGEPPAPESRIHEDEFGPWSGDAHLLWRGQQPGRELVLAFDAPRAGRFHVQAYLSMGPHYGIHELRLNGQSVGDPVDLFHTSPRLREPLDLGEISLREKGNELQVRVVSTSKFASPKTCSFGLDSLVLEEVAPKKALDERGLDEGSDTVKSVLSLKMVPLL